MNQEKFKQSITLMGGLFGMTVSETQMILYWKILKNHDEKKFCDACTKLCEEFKPTSQVPFPLPAHFLEIINGKPEETARIALCRLKDAIGCVGSGNSIDFGDRALHAVVESYGGWPVVCRWNNEDWKIKETAFVQNYIAFKRYNNGPDYLVGRWEIDNGGFTEYNELVFFPVTPEKKPLKIIKKTDGKKELAGDKIVKELCYKMGVK